MNALAWTRPAAQVVAFGAPVGVVTSPALIGTARARNLTPAAVRKRQSRALAAVGRGVVSADMDLEGAAYWLTQEGYPCQSDPRSIGDALRAYIDFRVSLELADLLRTTAGRA